MVIFDRQETGLCFTKGRRMYLYTDEIAVWLFIDIISGTYLRINNYTVILRDNRAALECHLFSPWLDFIGRTSGSERSFSLMGAGELYG